MSFPNYFYIPVVDNVPHRITQLKSGDLIESRIGENRIKSIQDDGIRSITIINTMYGLISTTSEQEWLTFNGWRKTSELLPGMRILHRTEFVQIYNLGLIKPDRVYTLITMGEYMVAGHVTQ